MIKYEKLNSHVFVTKLAGFEHTEYIQNYETRKKVNDTDIPLVQAKNIKNGRFVEQYDWYISKKISDSLTRSKLDKRCILIPYVGYLREVGIFEHPYDCHLASNIAKVELVDDYFNLDYLKYYLQSNIGQAYLFQSKQGSAQANVTMESIRNTLVIDKSKEKQLKIAKILKNIDTKIDNNNKINTELEKIINTMYNYWFLQYEFPNEHGEPYKSSKGKMVWNKSLKKEIPEGWKVENILENSISKIILSGVDIFKYEKNYLATANVNGVSIQEGEWVTYENRESRANMQPKINSVWFAKMKDSIKHITFTKSSEELIKKYILSTGFFGIQCKDYALSYIHSFIYSSNFEKQKDILAHGATQEAVNNQDLKSIKITIPKKEVLEKFNSNIYKLLELQNRMIIENQELQNLKSFILPLLINGQIN